MFTIAPFNHAPLPRRCRVFLLSYALILVVLSLGAALHPDAYYYWQWSHQLALGYYDGPPMIAWVLKLLTMLFGDQAFSIHLLGVASAMITAWWVFHLTQHLFDRRAAEAALYVWLLTLGVARFFFLENSYNSLLIIFWAFMLYGFIQLLEKQRRRDYYICAVMAALMLLTKYSAAILLLSLLFVLASRHRYRQLFKSIHMGLALLLLLLLCSPLLIWNISHHWITLRYLFAQGFHAHKHYGHEVNLAFYGLSAWLNYNVALLTLLYFLVRDYSVLWGKVNVQLLFIPMVIVWLFFFVAAWFSLPMMNWNAPCALPAACLLGYFISRKQVATWFRRSLFFVMATLTLVFALGCRFPRAYIFPDLAWNSSTAMLTLMNQLPIAQHNNAPIMTSAWYMLPSWLAAQYPQQRTHIFALNSSGHHYYLWWQQAQQHHDYRGQSVLYLSQQSLARLPGRFYPSLLQSCHLLAKATTVQQRWFYPDYLWQLYLYRCRIKR